MNVCDYAVCNMIPWMVIISGVVIILRLVLKYKLEDVI